MIEIKKDPELLMKILLEETKPEGRPIEKKTKIQIIDYGSRRHVKANQ